MIRKRGLNLKETISQPKQHRDVEMKVEGGTEISEAEREKVEREEEMERREREKAVRR